MLNIKDFELRLEGDNPKYTLGDNVYYVYPYTDERLVDIHCVCDDGFLLTKEGKKIRCPKCGGRTVGKECCKDWDISKKVEICRMISPWNCYMANSYEISRDYGNRYKFGYGFDIETVQHVPEPFVFHVREDAASLQFLLSKAEYDIRNS